MSRTRSCLIAAALVLAPGIALAQDEVSVELFTVNNLWMMMAAALVFIMHLGFASLESGLTQAKNTVNILFKNVFIICAGILTYAIVGFNLMYPGDFALEGAGGGIFGFAGFGITTDADGITSKYNVGYTYWTDFLFQAMFAATAATIVSGAVAERIKLSSFMVFSVLFVSITYTIAGSWQWGGGWLSANGFHDFAGSTIVHSVGGWGALVGAWMLGPRLGKYVGSQIHPIPGSSLPLAAIGVFLLWLGWFGFNGGSVLSADAGGVSYVLVTTSLAAAAGGFVASITSWFQAGKPDLSMALNGILAGLVGITAGADTVGVMSSVVIGAIAGVIVVFSVLTFDRIKIDDPVGAISVHLVCGIWGTLAVGIFGTDKSFLWQVIGVLSYGVFAAGTAFVFFSLVKATMGLRVSAEEESEGLDFGEHGGHAYDLGSRSSGLLDEMTAPRVVSGGAGARAVAPSES